MNELEVIDQKNPSLNLYEKMQTAILDCRSFDDLHNIAEKAQAISAYYKQIKDEQSLKRFLEIKLRAWRRIGEVLSQIDDSDCPTVAARIRKVRAGFGNVLNGINDTALGQALRVADLPADFFEREVRDHKSIYSLLFAYQALQTTIANEAYRIEKERWAATPEGKKEIVEKQKEEMRRQREREELERQRTARLAEEAQEREQEAMDLIELRKIRNEAFNEVGFTLDRHDREQMKQIVFLLKKQIYEILRQAAFDNRMTMQAILRQGLVLWFIAHGYDVEIKEMDLRPKPKKAS